jgi:hypothetical protein
VSHLPSATSTPLQRTALQRHPNLHIDASTRLNSLLSLHYPYRLFHGISEFAPTWTNPAPLELHLHQLTTATLQGILARQLLTTTL